MKQDLLRYFGRASGRVQGVGFRCFVQTNAQTLGVTGWVRNMDDGSVTMEMQGTARQIEDLAARIKKGSVFIKVRELALEERPLLAAEKDFVVRY